MTVSNCVSPGNPGSFKFAISAMCASPQWQPKNYAIISHVLQVVHARLECRRTEPGRGVQFAGAKPPSFQCFALEGSERNFTNAAEVSGVGFAACTAAP